MNLAQTLHNLARQLNEDPSVFVYAWYAWIERSIDVLHAKAECMILAA